MNRTVKLLMLSDIFVITGFGLVDPILAIFVKENLIGGTIFAAGFASTIFLITKCLIQLPFSRYVDSHYDKIKWLLVGTFLIAAVPFIYTLSRHVNWIYFAQFIHGVGSGLAYPTWLGLWSTHLDKKHESFEWSLYSALTGLGTAGTASLGAGIAGIFGFQYAFMIGGLMSMVGSFILFWLEKKRFRKLRISALHYHKKRKLFNRHFLTA